MCALTRVQDNSRVLSKSFIICFPSELIYPIFLNILYPNREVPVVNFTLSNILSQKKYKH